MALTLDEGTRIRLREMCREYAVVRLRMFGSAITESFDPMRSDLDLLVVFGDVPIGMSPARQYFGFKEELELLFSRAVDLLEERAIENPYLKRNADAEAVVLYAA